MSPKTNAGTFRGPLVVEVFGEYYLNECALKTSRAFGDPVGALAMSAAPVRTLVSLSAVAAINRELQILIHIYSRLTVLSPFGKTATIVLPPALPRKAKALDRRTPQRHSARTLGAVMRTSGPRGLGSLTRISGMKSSV